MLNENYALTISKLKTFRFRNSPYGWSSENMKYICASV